MQPTLLSVLSTKRSRWIKEDKNRMMSCVLVCSASRIACLTSQSGVVLTSWNWHLFIACCLTLCLHYTVGSRGGRAKRHRRSLLALTSREALWCPWSSAKRSCQGSLQYSLRSSLTTLDTTHNPNQLKPWNLLLCVSSLFLVNATEIKETDLQAFTLAKAPHFKASVFN